MATLLEQTTAFLKGRQSTASEVYKSLVHRADNPKPGDAEKLADVLTALGKTPADFERDVSALAELRTLEASLLTDEALAELKSRVQAGVAKVNEDVLDIIVAHFKSMDPMRMRQIAATFAGLGMTELIATDSRRAALKNELVNVERANDDARRRIAELRQQHAIVLQ